MSIRLVNAAIGASIGAAVLLAAVPGQAAWWNIFDRDKKEAARPQPEPPTADPLPLQTAPIQPAPGQQVAPVQPAPGQTGPMQAAPAPTVAAPGQAVPGRPAAPVPPADVAMPTVDNPAAEMARLETQVRALTGQVEQLQHQLGELRETLLAVQEDNESRLQALEGGTPTDSGALSALKDRLGQPMDGGGGDLNPPAANATGPGDPPQTLGTLPLSNNTELRMSSGGTEPPPAERANPNAPMNLAPATPPRDGAPAERRTTETASLSPKESPELAYDRAYGLIVAGDYAPAEESFRQFLNDHPDSELAADARYWLGETYFAREDYKKAADAFLVGYRQFPDGRRAPDSLLKLGLSLNALGERRAACSTYAELLGKYENVSNALLQRVRAEQARAEC